MDPNAREWTPAPLQRAPGSPGEVGADRQPGGGGSPVAVAQPAQTIPMGYAPASGCAPAACAPATFYWGCGNGSSPELKEQQEYRQGGCPVFSPAPAGIWPEVVPNGGCMDSAFVSVVGVWMPTPQEMQASLPVDVDAGFYRSSQQSVPVCWQMPMAPVGGAPQPVPVLAVEPGDGAAERHAEASWGAPAPAGAGSSEAAMEAIAAEAVDSMCEGPHEAADTLLNALGARAQLAPPAGESAPRPPPEEEDGQLEFVSPGQARVSVPAQPPPEQEKQLLGELLFLRAWPVARSAAESTEEVPKLCGRVVGMLLQLPPAELDQLIRNNGSFCGKVQEAIRALTGKPCPVRVAKKEKGTGSGSAGDAAVGKEPKDAGGLDPGILPPPERHGDLLYIALSSLVGDVRLALHVTARLLSDLTADDVRGCLAEEKRLRTAVRAALKALEREQKVEREARALLTEFVEMPPERRVEIFPFAGAGSTAPPAAAGGGTGAGGAGRADFSRALALLRTAKKHAQDPQVVARKVARAAGAAAPAITQLLLDGFDQCGISRTELQAFGLRWSGQVPSASRRTAGAGGRSPGARGRQRSASRPRGRAQGPQGQGAAAPASAAGVDAARGQPRPGSTARGARSPGRRPEGAAPPGPAPGPDERGGPGAGRRKGRGGQGEAAVPQAQPQVPGQPKEARPPRSPQQQREEQQAAPAARGGAEGFWEEAAEAAKPAPAAGGRAPASPQAAAAPSRGAAQEVPGLLRVPGLAESLREQAAPSGGVDAVEDAVAAVREALGGDDERGRQPPSWRDALHRQPAPQRPPEQAKKRDFRVLAQDEALFPSLGGAAGPGRGASPAPGSLLLPKQKGSAASQQGGAPGVLQRSASSDSRAPATAAARSAWRTKSVDPGATAVGAAADGAAAAGAPAARGRVSWGPAEAAPAPAPWRSAGGPRGGAAAAGAAPPPSPAEAAPASALKSRRAASMEPLQMSGSHGRLGWDVGPIAEEPRSVGSRPAAAAAGAGGAAAAVRSKSIPAKPEQLQEKGPKKKGHKWSAMDNAFELVRAKTGPGGAAAAPAAGAAGAVGSQQKAAGPSAQALAQQAAQLSLQEARLRLRAVAEEKMQAVEAEDFQLAARLKQEENSLMRHLEQQASDVPGGTRSWADLASRPGAPTSGPSPGRGRLGDHLARAARAASAEPSSARPGATSRADGAEGAVSVAPSQRFGAGGVPAKPGDGRGDGIVFFLTAPGELSADTFKPTTTHVSRRDALARIASAALWRGRGAAWEEAREVIFMFEDGCLLRISPRFVASCPVPSEYHLIMVIGRALEKEGAPGLRIVRPEAGKPMGGHAQRVVSEYARAGPAAVVLLHETYGTNLGLFGRAAGAAAARHGEDEDRTLIFFLGAVKDMAPDETAAVQRACRAHHVPCVEANLGQQAEFTSKIIDVLHGHNLHGRLAPAVWRCAEGPAWGGACGPEGPGRSTAAPKGTFWVLQPVGGGPRDLAADDRKRDGMYEVPRSCIAQLWCSKGEHKGHVLSFVFAAGDVLTVHPSLVTCLKMQHRAAPTERNLVSALKVAAGDQKADPSLVIDDGCVTLGDAAALAADGKRLLDRDRTVFLDLELGSDDPLFPRLDAYGAADAAAGGGDVRDVVVLMRQANGRDFPRNFRENLASVLLGGAADAADGKGASGEKKRRPRWLRASLPQMSVHGSISLLAHYWHTRALAPALASRLVKVQRRILSRPSDDRADAPAGDRAEDPGAAAAAPPPPTPGPSQAGGGAPRPEAGAGGAAAAATPPPSPKAPPPWRAVLLSRDSKAAAAKDTKQPPPSPQGPGARREGAAPPGRRPEANGAAAISILRREDAVRPARQPSADYGAPGPRQGSAWLLGGPSLARGAAEPGGGRDSSPSRPSRGPRGGGARERDGAEEPSGQASEGRQRRGVGGADAAARERRGGVGRTPERGRRDGGGREAEAPGAAPAAGRPRSPGAGPRGPAAARPDRSAWGDAESLRSSARGAPTGGASPAPGGDGAAPDRPPGRGAAAAGRRQVREPPASWEQRAAEGDGRPGESGVRDAWDD